MVQMPWLSPPYLVEILHRVDRGTVDHDLIMAMRTSDTTGRSLVADDLALLDGLPRGNGHAAHVAVQGLDAVPMVQRHRDTVTPVPADLFHSPVCRRADRCAIRSCNVDTVMHFATAAAKGVGTPAKRRRNKAIERPDGRRLRKYAVVLGGGVLEDDKVLLTSLGFFLHDSSRRRQLCCSFAQATADRKGRRGRRFEDRRQGGAVPADAKRLADLCIKGTQIVDILLECRQFRVAGADGLVGGIKLSRLQAHDLIKTPAVVLGNSVLEPRVLRNGVGEALSLIHISEPTRLGM